MTDETSQPVIYEIAVREIIRQHSLQGRVELHEPSIKSYANVLKTGGILPPIELGRIGPRLYLLDGWHRVAAATDLGKEKVRATIREFPNLRALTIAAASVNTAHGVQLKPKDHRRRLTMFIGAKGHCKPGGGLMSYREITQVLGGAVAYTTIRNWIRKDHPRVAQRLAEPSRDLSETWEWSPPERTALRKQVARCAETLLAAVSALHQIDAAIARDEVQEAVAKLNSVLEAIDAGRPPVALKGAMPLPATDDPKPGLLPPALDNDDF